MKGMRMAALAIAMTLMFSGLALARDHDDDKHKDDHWDRQADHDRNHDRDHDRDRDHREWQNRDHDRDRDHWWDRNRDWNRDRQQREHERWQREHRHDDGFYRGGQIYNRYPQSYPGGGVYGYPGGGNPGGGYPSGGYGYPGSVYGRGGNGRNAAYGFGYQDGSYMARKDISQNKRFNPSPRNEYGNRTHGYNSSFGDKNYYKAEYSNGYSAGYEANYRGGRGW
jgi:hypothetical protein